MKNLFKESSKTAKSKVKNAKFVIIKSTILFPLNSNFNYFPIINILHAYITFYFKGRTKV